MASYQKRGKTWQYTISNKGKLIRKSGFRTKKEAQVAAAEVENELRRGFVVNLSPVPFADYFLKWLGIFKSEVSSNTLARYKNSHKTIDDHFGSKPIQEITKAQYRSFLNDYQKDGDKAKQTVRKLNTHVRACVKEAIDEGIIRVDFTRDVKFPGREGKRGEEKHLGYEESQKLMNYFLTLENKSTTDYLLLLGLTSAMRFGELVGLTRKDFNFVTNEIIIDKTWGYNNKMQKGFGTTKNMQSVRKIKISKQIMKIFDKWFNQTPENTLRLVFFSPKSKYHCVSNTSAAIHLKSICRELGIQEISPHGLRHTKASVMLYRKISLLYVSEYLGHKDIETTLKDYSHVIKELREEDEKKMLQELV